VLSMQSAFTLFDYLTVADNALIVFAMNSGACSKLVSTQMAKLQVLRLPNSREVLLCMGSPWCRPTI
jgi:hypothetical protein